ncbi:MAG: hypothetical protein Q7S11_03000 [bacterium]|nr:hypothetical protein [bacterium]
MIILPETIRGGNDEQSLFLSDLGIYSGQEYENAHRRADVIINFSSWYSAEGAYWGEGGLSVDDFHNIFEGLKNHHTLAFFVVPQEMGLLCPHEDIVPDEVAEWCMFIITASCVYVFNDYKPWTAEELSRKNIPFQYAKRDDAKSIMAMYRYH